MVNISAAHSSEMVWLMTFRPDTLTQVYDEIKLYLSLNPVATNISLNVPTT